MDVIPSELSFTDIQHAFEQIKQLNNYQTNSQSGFA